MIVGDFYLHSALVCPDKAHSPLVIDPDAVLPLSVPTQGFQSVGGWHPKVSERYGCQYPLYSHSRSSLDVRRQSPNVPSNEEALSVVILESPHECQ